jgi:hypothetical protein
MRFAVWPPDRITEDVARLAYLAGPDRIPWRTRTRWAEGQLMLERSVAEAAVLHIPWEVRGRGLVTLTTGTLSERLQPYDLPLELARGKVGQVRNQLAEWRMAGLEVPGAVQQKCAEAVRLLGRAAVGQRGCPRSVEMADQCLGVALEAVELLAIAYTEQALAVRRQSPRPQTLLGADLGRLAPDEYVGKKYLQAFNAAVVPMAWKEIETTEGAYAWDLADRQVQWCRDHGLAVFAGPLVQLDAHAIPDWLPLCEGDFEGLSCFASEFVEAVVRRYRGRIDAWIAAGRLNTAEVLSLTEEEKIKLAARSVELARCCDPEAQILISFDQPWGEYLSHKEHDFPPLHFADALLRAGLGLTGLVLEVNLGYWPDGTLPRDLVDFSQQIDYWSCLDVPLVVALAVPSRSDFDPLAQRPVTPLTQAWTPTLQRQWVSRYVPLLLAKSSVQGVFWSQLRDFQPHAFPHGGLFDLRRAAKPALQELASIRQTYLR